MNTLEFRQTILNNNIMLNAKYKKCVILGAGGFIGINLAHALTKNGFETICFDRFLSPHWPKDAKTIVDDFGKFPDELLKILDDAFVLHLISSSLPSPKTQFASDEVSNDLVTTIKFLEMTLDRSLRWIFLSSGGTVYGDGGQSPLDELSPTNPICSYGAVKLSIERYFALYHQIHDLDYVTLRLSNPYGPWQYPLKGQGLISVLLYNVLNNIPVEIWGDGYNVRDYIYIDDAIDGIIAAGIKDQSNGIYNIGTGDGLTIKQLIGKVEEVVGKFIDVRYCLPRHFDVRYNVLNIKKITTKTSWKPKLTISEGIKLTADWVFNKVK